MRTILAALAAALTLGACTAEPEGHSNHSRIEVDVEASTYEMRRFVDNEYGVVCYYSGYRTMSCVKAR